MVDRTQVMSMFLSVCPSFRQTWDEYTRSPEYDEELLYVHLGELARHLVALYDAGDTSEFAAVFRVVEDLHVHGDPQVREAATVGLLESIQNNAEHRDVEVDAFLPFLGPESAGWWERLHRFWDGDREALRE